MLIQFTILHRWTDATATRRYRVPVLTASPARARKQPKSCHQPANNRDQDVRIAKDLLCRIGSGGMVMKRVDVTEDSVDHERNCVDERLSVMCGDSDRTHRIETVT